MLNGNETGGTLQDQPRLFDRAPGSPADGDVEGVERFRLEVRVVGSKT